MTGLKQNLLSMLNLFAGGVIAKAIDDSGYLLLVINFVGSNKRMLSAAAHSVEQWVQCSWLFWALAQEAVLLLPVFGKDLQFPHLSSL